MEHLGVLEVAADITEPVVLVHQDKEMPEEMAAHKLIHIAVVVAEVLVLQVAHLAAQMLVALEGLAKIQNQHGHLLHLLAFLDITQVAAAVG
jgi:hypothetical protein